MMNENDRIKLTIQYIEVLRTKLGFEDNKGFHKALDLVDKQLKSFVKTNSSIKKHEKYLERCKL